MIDILPYSVEYKQQWNEIIDEADNGHFMFKRDFMDYHADRFQDCSYILLYDNKPIGVIPGNIKDKKWYSHQGLSFGGIFIRPRYNRVLIINGFFQKLFTTLQQNNVTDVIYKFIPHIYHRKPCDADRYVLSSQKKAKEIVEVSSTIDLTNMNKFSELRIRGKKKAAKSELVYSQSADWQGFWNVLSARLGDKYEKKPVHTLEEILLLHNNFPQNIKLFTANHAQEDICAGVVIFETAKVVHCQYIAASDFGIQVCALDGLFDFLINTYANTEHTYFNFGISTESEGTILNENLIQYKEGFGAQSVVHVTNHYILQE